MEHCAIWGALEELKVDKRYVDVLRTLYRGQRGQVVADKSSKKFSIERGTKQGDPISPALFNAVIEVVMRRLKAKWAKQGYGVKILTRGEGKFLQNLRFADDLLLTGRSLPQVRQMLEDLAEGAGEVGLQLHMGKTKILSNARVRRGLSAAKQVKVGTEEVEILPVDESTMYLGKKFCMGEKHHDVELDHRLARAWAKFMS